MKDTNYKADNIDLEPICVFLKHKHGWSVKDLKRVIPQYRNFLVLAQAGQNTRLALTNEVDKIWHAHILHTEKYQKDCQKYLGKMIHHYPRDYSIADSANSAQCSPTQPGPAPTNDCSDIKQNVRCELKLAS